MGDQSLLEEVIESLDQDSNILRIKRLILFTCHDVWAQDVEEVRSLDLRQLISDLMTHVSDLSMLKQMLNSHIKRLSKQADYLIAADAIIDSIGLLYGLPASELAGLVNQNLPSQEGFIPPPPNLPPRTIKPGHRRNKTLTNPFELRLEISRNISPLHAKILLYSVLHYRCLYGDKDWSGLNTYDLDDLLNELFATCPTSTILEEKLTQTAQSLDIPDDANRAAAVILQAMHDLYEPIN